ncbi:ABC transporter permease [Siccirubricoccus phaeus]|uniref:ABC transporter permease n=1 Tax=Siccirubricoccus phaeus TaxID=2595053 RepID=UPI001F1C9C80|nr:ABC transporter permease [Siccirubricoccus phaeus]
MVAAETGLDLAWEGSSARLRLPARLELPAVGEAWRHLLPQLDRAKALVIEAKSLTSLDTAGAVLLLRLERAAPTEWQGLAEGPAKAMLERCRAALEGVKPPAPDNPLPPIAALGRSVVEAVRGLFTRIGFLGEVVVTFLGQLRRPGRFRFGELLRHLDEAGLRAFGLTILLGTLIGIILAFQSSIPMRQFGAEIFIPNLVGISLLRELGPLMAGIILAGRTGSAYAAELGTMVVNEEVDALGIIGISPLGWLVLPRLVAAIMVMPVLALLMDLTGLIGMAVVMASLGFTPIAVIHQLQTAVQLGDLAGGLFKAAAFGGAIGFVGCRAGLAAGRGPRAVGDAATSAVVAGIVAIVVLDGIFAILFFRLGW